MRLRFYHHQRTLRAPFFFAFALTCIIVAGHIEPVFAKIDGYPTIHIVARGLSMKRSANHSLLFQIYQRG